MPARLIESWNSLSNAERIALCRTMTATAIKLAELSPPNIAEAFLQLAECWARLGTEITHASLAPANQAQNP